MKTKATAKALLRIASLLIKGSKGSEYTKTLDSLLSQDDVLDLARQMTDYVEGSRGSDASDNEIFNYCVKQLKASIVRIINTAP